MDDTQNVVYALEITQNVVYTSFVEYLSSIRESMANKNTRHRGEPGACFCLDGQKRERPNKAKKRAIVRFAGSAR